MTNEVDYTTSLAWYKVYAEATREKAENTLSPGYTWSPKRNNQQSDENLLLNANHVLQDPDESQPNRIHESGLEKTKPEDVRRLVFRGKHDDAAGNEHSTGEKACCKSDGRFVRQKSDDDQRNALREGFGHHDLPMAFGMSRGGRSRRCNGADNADTNLWSTAWSKWFSATGLGVLSVQPRHVVSQRSFGLESRLCGPLGVHWIVSGVIT
jgi:hypothetical protein